MITARSEPGEGSGFPRSSRYTARRSKNERKRKPGYFGRDNRWPLRLRWHVVTAHGWAFDISLGDDGE